MISPSGNTQETVSGTERPFEFGKNWAGFLRKFNEGRVSEAQQSLRMLLKMDDLQGRRFLDAGSGSGLFSLAAHRLGADVVSFDVDDQSVACTQELRRRTQQPQTSWDVHQGSLRDPEFLSQLGKFDVIYCWGVAHHSGAMWQAIENLLKLAGPGGSVVLAIYNDQLYVSRIWRGIKLIYQRLPVFMRPFYAGSIAILLLLKRGVVTLLASILRLMLLRNPLVPFINWYQESQGRGMDLWHDLLDWVGGWPFEVARPEDVFRFLRDRGFSLAELTTCSGHGCNEFVFVRVSS
ncbi:MAG: class I SAM-dependent methyltransferase [Planctomyces sp.]|jgi:SAM-dependent methyltransferase